MQIIDWISSEKWTDDPECVHPTIRAVAIHANDSLNDVRRQELIDLIPRMMNTASDDRVLHVRLAVWCARRVLGLFEAKHPNDSRPRAAIEAAEAWAENPSEENRKRAAAAANATYAANAANAAAYANKGDLLAFLRELLDEYDRLTGRTAAVLVRPDYAPVCAVMAGNDSK